MLRRAHACQAASPPLWLMRLVAFRLVRVRFNDRFGTFKRDPLWLGIVAGPGGRLLLEQIFKNVVTTHSKTRSVRRLHGYLVLRNYESNGRHQAVGRCSTSQLNGTHYRVGHVHKSPVGRDPLSSWSRPQVCSFTSLCVCSHLLITLLTKSKVIASCRCTFFRQR